MDVVAVSAGLKSFIRRHYTKFDELNKRQSQLLEMGALALAAEHYRTKGYTVSPANLQGGSFRVKLSTRGHPKNYSWFRCEREHVFEIHANAPVRGAYGLDEGTYVVDVGVVREGVWGRNAIAVQPAIDNSELLTFIEAKRLVIYPMLIAQFIGIVHEVKPDFLRGRRPYGFVRDSHFDPLWSPLAIFMQRQPRSKEPYRIGGSESRSLRPSIYQSLNFESE